MQQPHRGNAVWWVCLTCEQQLTGAMRTGLAEASWSRVCVQAEESAERRCAVVNLADARVSQARYAEAERINREVLDVRRWVLGDVHPDTRMSACKLALALSYQGKYTDAERIEREVLSVGRRVLGEEHPSTLTTVSNLARSLSDLGKHAEAQSCNLAVSLCQGKHAEAEDMPQAALAAQRRVLVGAIPPRPLLPSAWSACGLKCVPSS
jgi:hypothetical protein